MRRQRRLKRGGTQNTKPALHESIRGNTRRVERGLVQSSGYTLHRCWHRSNRPPDRAETMSSPASDSAEVSEYPARLRRADRGPFGRRSSAKSDRHGRARRPSSPKVCIPYGRILCTFRYPSMTIWNRQGAFSRWATCSTQHAARSTQTPVLKYRRTAVRTRSVSSIVL